MGLCPHPRPKIHEEVVAQEGRQLQTLAWK
mgnify:CR=1 FL=1